MVGVPIAEWLQALQFIAEGTTFVMFILEESIQTGSLAAWMMLRAGKKAEAREAITATINGPLYFLRQVIDQLGWLAPYSAGSFDQFARMSDMSLHYLFQLTFA